LLNGVAALRATDPDLAIVMARFGPPPLWARRPGFATLVQIVLERQVSLASARARFGRLRAACGAITPECFATYSELEVRSAGVTRLRRRPEPERLRRLAVGWAPWRAVAARILWHHYLSTRGGRHP